MRSSRLLLLSIVLAGTGCAGLADARRRELTSGQTGCFQNELTIREYQREFDHSQWLADCGGKTYLCVAGVNDFACHERESSAKVAPTVPAP